MEAPAHGGVEAVQGPRREAGGAERDDERGVEAVLCEPQAQTAAVIGAGEQLHPVEGLIVAEDGGESTLLYY